MNMKSMKKTGGLRRRWLLNTVGVVFALGLVCVMAVTASYATYYYSNMQSDMENRAKTTTDFLPTISIRTTATTTSPVSPMPRPLRTRAN